MDGQLFTVHVFPVFVIINALHPGCFSQGALQASIVIPALSSMTATFWHLFFQ